MISILIKEIFPVAVIISALIATFYPQNFFQKSESEKLVDQIIFPENVIIESNNNQKMNEETPVIEVEKQVFLSGSANVDKTEGTIKEKIEIKTQEKDKEIEIPKDKLDTLTKEKKPEEITAPPTEKNINKKESSLLVLLNKLMKGIGSWLNVVYQFLRTLSQSRIVQVITVLVQSLGWLFSVILLRLYREQEKKISKQN